MVYLFEKKKDFFSLSKCFFFYTKEMKHMEFIWIILKLETRSDYGKLLMFLLDLIVIN